MDTPAQDPVAPQPAPKYSFTHVLIGLLFLFALFIGGYGWYWWKTTPPETQQEHVQTLLSPTPADLTADWKTYKDSANGFSIQYPKKWIEPINETDYAVISDIRFAPSDSNLNEANKNPGYVIEITITKGNQVQPTFNGYEKYKSRGATTTIIDGVEATTISNFGLDVPRVQTYFKKDNTLYAIQLRFHGDKYISKNGVQDEEKDFPEAKKIYDHMLSTFTFIQPQSSVTPSVVQTPTSKITPTPTVTAAPTPKPEPIITYSTSSDNSLYIITGRVFDDTNCDQVKDWNEMALEGFTVSANKIPEYYDLGSTKSAVDGFTITIPRNGQNSLKVQVNVTSQPGYQSYIHPTPAIGTISFTPANSKAFVNLPQLAYGNIKNCH
jgi:hypothetical protein